MGKSFCSGTKSRLSVVAMRNRPSDSATYDSRVQDHSHSVFSEGPAEKLFSPFGDVFPTAPKLPTPRWTAPRLLAEIRMQRLANDLRHGLLTAYRLQLEKDLGIGIEIQRRTLHMLMLTSDRVPVEFPCTTMMP